MWYKIKFVYAPHLKRGSNSVHHLVPCLGSREEQCLPPLGQVLYYSVHGLSKAEVQYPVCLVQNWSKQWLGVKLLFM